MLVDDLNDGFYKIRLRAKGPWVPVRLWTEDGERDPETWELLSDQKLAGEWAPRTDSARQFRINPWRFVNRLTPITKEEYQWLLILRTIPSRPASQKR